MKKWKDGRGNEAREREKTMTVKAVKERKEVMRGEKWQRQF